MRAAANRDVCVRVNTLRCSASSPALLEFKYSIGAKSLSEELFVVPRENRDVLTRSPEVTRGEVYAQSLPSALVSYVLRPTAGSDVLDLCAAPGSKASHLCALTRNTGTVIANDLSHARVGRLRGVLSLLGAKAVVMSRDATTADAVWGGQMSHVLADVPCSGEGRFGADPDLERGWDAKRSRRLTKVQRGVLRAGLRCLRPGGRLVYSTCTLNATENEGVLREVLCPVDVGRREPTDWGGISLKLRGDGGSLRFRLDPVALGPLRALPGAVPAVGSVREGGVRVLPHELHEGFFAVALERV